MKDLVEWDIYMDSLHNLFHVVSERNAPTDLEYRVPILLEVFSLLEPHAHSSKEFVERMIECEFTFSISHAIYQAVLTQDNPAGETFVGRGVQLLLALTVHESEDLAFECSLLDALLQASAESSLPTRIRATSLKAIARLMRTNHGFSLAGDMFSMDSPSPKVNFGDEKRDPQSPQDLGTVLVACVLTAEDELVGPALEAIDYISVDYFEDIVRAGGIECLAPVLSRPVAANEALIRRALEVSTNLCEDRFLGIFLSSGVWKRIVELFAEPLSDQRPFASIVYALLRPIDVASATDLPLLVSTPYFVKAYCHILAAPTLSQQAAALATKIVEAGNQLELGAGPSENPIRDALYAFVQARSLQDPQEGSRLETSLASALAPIGSTST